MSGGERDHDRAHVHDHAHGPDTSGGRRRDPLPGETPEEFWERRYGGERVWSGRVNRALAEVVAELDPGRAGDAGPARALDLGCGEGGDVLWLAERGWDATGIDLSTRAVARARAAADELELGNARFIAADLSEWARNPSGVDGAADGFELVTAGFLQSPVELARAEILRTAARRVVPGGRLVVLSHAAPPPRAEHRMGDFPTPEGELAMLDLDPEHWQVVIAEVRRRSGEAPEGGGPAPEDTVVVARRRS